MGDYPSIAKACFLIALDNDGINRDRTERRWAREFSRWMHSERWPPEVLSAIDEWLSTKNEDELEIICCGETREMTEALIGAPLPTNDFLNRYFEEVC